MATQLHGNPTKGVVGWHNPLNENELHPERTQKIFLEWIPTVFDITQGDLENHTETIPVPSSRCRCKEEIANSTGKLDIINK